MSGFNFPERYIPFLNVLIGIVIIYFLVLSIDDVIRLRLASTVLPTQSEFTPSRGTPEGIRVRPRAYYETIVRRDIFNLAPAPQAAPVENEKLDIKLIGTSEISSGKPYAVIEDPTGNQNLYRVGEQIPNAGQLLEVAQNRAIIMHNGHRVALDIPRETPAPAAPFPNVVPGQMRRLPRPAMRGRRAPRSGVRKLSNNRYVLDRSTVDSNIHNMAPLFSQIRATPDLQNGVSGGFRLTEIQPGSIFEQIGLQDGDLLKSVNGQSIADPGRAMTMLQSLQNQRSITLNVVRNGSPTQLYYNIR